MVVCIEIRVAVKGKTSVGLLWRLYDVLCDGGGGGHNHIGMCETVYAFRVPARCTGTRNHHQQALRPRASRDPAARTACGACSAGVLKSRAGW